MMIVGSSYSVPEVAESEDCYSVGRGQIHAAWAGCWDFGIANRFLGGRLGKRGQVIALCFTCS
jgi:hypothetical protein